MRHLFFKSDFPGKKPAGYYILMRETTRPFLEKKVYVTGSSAKLDYSKDNYFFAAQAVDVDVRESSLLFPKAGR